MLFAEVKAGVVERAPVSLHHKKAWAVASSSDGFPLASIPDLDGRALARLPNGAATEGEEKTFEEIAGKTSNVKEPTAAGSVAVLGKLDRAVLQRVLELLPNVG